jgi:ATP-dependent Clp protease ATP-binding subunit ClpA
VPDRLDRVLARLDEHGMQAIQLARQEAYDRHFGYVGTESLVVGVLLEAQQRNVGPWGLSLERIRAVVAQRVGSGPAPVAEPASIPMTPRAVEILAQAEQEAQRLQSERVMSEHILLGLVEVGAGEGLIAVVEAGTPLGKLRRDLERSLRARS